MKRTYDPETDSLDIAFKASPDPETRVIAAGFNVDFDEAGAVLGLDIDHASQKLGLTTWETDSLPFRSIRAA